MFPDDRQSGRVADGAPPVDGARLAPPPDAAFFRSGLGPAGDALAAAVAQSRGGGAR
jgi:hypothetical protein